MAKTYHLLRANPDISATGHHTIEVKVRETMDDQSTVTGIMEKYGISGAELNHRFGGDVERWLDWVGMDMLVKYQRQRDVQVRLLALHGTSKEIKNNISS